MKYKACKKKKKGSIFITDSSSGKKNLFQPLVSSSKFPTCQTIHLLESSSFLCLCLLNTILLVDKCFDILQSTKLTAGVILLTLKDYLSS